MIEKFENNVFTKIIVGVFTIIMIVIEFINFRDYLGNISWVTFTNIGVYLIPLIIYLFIPKSFAITSRVMGIFIGTRIAYQLLFIIRTEIESGNLIVAIVFILLSLIILISFLAIFLKWQWIMIFNEIIILTMIFANLYFKNVGTYNNFQELIILSILFIINSLLIVYLFIKNREMFKLEAIILENDNNIYTKILVIINGLTLIAATYVIYSFIFLQYSFVFYILLALIIVFSICYFIYPKIYYIAFRILTVVIGSIMTVTLMVRLISFTFSINTIIYILSMIGIVVSLYLLMYKWEYLPVFLEFVLIIGFIYILLKSVSDYYLFRFVLTSIFIVINGGYFGYLLFNNRKLKLLY